MIIITKDGKRIEASNVSIERDGVVLIIGDKRVNMDNIRLVGKS